MINKIKAHLDKIPLILILFLAGVLRLENLGYSDYQGDEIKAFLDPTGYSNVFEFLINQRKGPGQFLITYLIEFINQNES